MKSYRVCYGSTGRWYLVRGRERIYSNEKKALVVKMGLKLAEQMWQTWNERSSISIQRKDGRTQRSREFGRR